MTPPLIDPGPLSDAFARACERLERTNFVTALWQRQADLWSQDPATRQQVAHRLGWLGAVGFVTPHLPRLRACANTVRDEGFTDVVLLGMGGSSLAPEVLRRVIGVADGYPRFRMLDSTDPDAVRSALSSAASSLFVLASKSGSTIEPHMMAEEARRRVIEAGHREWGQRFIAITDEGTALHRKATSERFRDVFVNPADIGGRYSALSFFGLVPAALMGQDVDGVIAAAREMDVACRRGIVSDNPAVALGALMAAGAQAGFDKLTLVAPAALAPFSLWVEQLIAESTGKQGKGIVPIGDEAAAVSWGADRLVVALGSEAGHTQSVVEKARAAKLPVVSIMVPDGVALGGEFLRWEVATATAGALLGINPFDEPNVQQAKDATRVLLDTYIRDRKLPVPEPHASVGRARFMLSSAAYAQLDGRPATSFLEIVRARDYVGLLVYLPPDDDAIAKAVSDCRRAIETSARVPVMVGFGPRYLHSTGQLHKGGPDSGVFVVVTTEIANDLPVPTVPFTFGVLERAQAAGDFQSLDRVGRRALHVHLPTRDPDALRQAISVLTVASPERTLTRPVSTP